jgi:hypothetical protein
MALTIENITRPAGAKEGQTLTSQLAVEGTPLKMTVTKVTFDNSYPTGGEVVTAAQLGLTTLREVIAVETLAPLAKTKTAVFDRTNTKLFISVEDGTTGVNAEAGSASDQSAVICLVTAIGE